MKYTFSVNYTTKVLTITYKDTEYTFDLNDGDVGDFWHSFTHEGETFDINFYLYDEMVEPMCSYYSLKEVDGELQIDTNSETPFDFIGSEGDVNNYLEN